ASAATGAPATSEAAPTQAAASALKTRGPQLGWADELSTNGKLNVATTVAPLSSIARNIGGDRINLHGIIPEQNRKLLTYHDSYAYFARRYGMTVLAAVQPSDFTEPSPREVADLIDQVKREQVPAIFGSEVFPSKVLEQIA